MLYGKSFHSAEEAIAEIQTKGSAFNKLIRYRPVVNQMLETFRAKVYRTYVTNGIETFEVFEVKEYNRTLTGGGNFSESGTRRDE